MATVFIFRKAGALTDTLTPIIRWAGVLTPPAVVLGKSPADISCSLVAALFLVRALMARDFAWAHQPWFKAGLLLWGYMILRALFAPDMADRLADALPFVRFLVFAAAMQTLVLTKTVWRWRLATAALIGLLALFSDALLQDIAGRDILGHRPYEGRLTAFYGGPRVGIMTAWLFLPPVLALLDMKRRWLAAAFGVLSMFVAVRSGDRMAFLLLLLYAALFGVLFFRSARRAVLLGVPAAILTVTAVVLINPGTFQRQVLSTVESIQNLDETEYGVIWKSGIDLFLDHPVFGVGPGGFPDACPDPKYGPPYYVRADGDKDWRCPTHPHNMYLEWLSETGLVGFGLFTATMALVFLPLWRLYRIGVHDWAFAGLFIVFLARLWPLTASTSFQHAWSGVPFWLVVGWSLAYVGLPRKT